MCNSLLDCCTFPLIKNKSEGSGDVDSISITDYAALLKMSVENVSWIICLHFNVLSAKLRYLQYIDNGNTAALHWSMDLFWCPYACIAGSVFTSETVPMELALSCEDRHPRGVSYQGTQHEQIRPQQSGQLHDWINFLSLLLELYLRCPVCKVVAQWLKEYSWAKFEIINPWTSLWTSTLLMVSNSVKK